MLTVNRLLNSGNVSSFFNFLVWTLKSEPFLGKFIFHTTENQLSGVYVLMMSDFLLLAILTNRSKIQFVPPQVLTDPIAKLSSLSSCTRGVQVQHGVTIDDMKRGQSGTYDRGWGIGFSGVGTR